MWKIDNSYLLNFMGLQCKIFVVLLCHTSVTGEGSFISNEFSFVLGTNNR